MKEFRSTLILISSISLFLFFPGLIAAQRVVERPNQEPSYKRPVVERVELKGANAFKAGEIERFLYTKPNHWFNFLKKRYLSKSNVRIDEATIKSFYWRRGYLFSQVQSDVSYTKNGKAVVTFYIEEGRRTYLSSVNLLGGLERINRKFDGTQASLKIGLPVNAEDVSSNGYKLRDLYADYGYPYAIDSSRYAFNNDSTRAMITYAVAESVFTVNDTTLLIGKGRTKPKVIYREIIAKPGKMYRQKDVVDSEQRLYTTSLFKFVSMRRNDSLAVIVNDTCHAAFELGLDERKQYFVGLGAGLGTQQYYDLVLRFFGQWGVRNISGTGRGLVLSVKPQFQITHKNGTLSGLHISDLGRKLHFNIVNSAFEADYVAPWFFKYRVPVTAKIIYEPYTLNPVSVLYRFDRLSGEGVFSRELDRFTTTRLTAHIEYIKIRNASPAEAQADRETGNNQIRRILQLYTERDTRDNILVPQKGSYSFGSAEYVGGILGGDFNYYKLQFSWSRYRILTGANVLATRAWLGWLNDTFKNGSSALSDRFIVGGATTIRGYTNLDLGPKFESGPLAGSAAGGRFMLVGNLEIRRPLFWRFGGTAFMDGGNAYSRISEITPLSIRFSAGMGLQFFTPVGPIRLDYAVRLKKQFDLGAGLFHLSILYAF